MFSLSESFPLIKDDPIVTPGVKNNRLMFECKFKSDDKDQHSIFEVTWYQGSPAVKIGEGIFKGSERIATLQNTNKYPNNPTFYLGSTVSHLLHLFSLISHHLLHLLTYSGLKKAQGGPGHFCSK